MNWRDLKSINLLIIVLAFVLVGPLIGSGLGSMAVVLGLLGAIGWAGFLLVGSGSWLRFFIATSIGIFLLWGLVAAGLDGLWSDITMDILGAMMIGTTLYIVLRHALLGSEAPMLDRVIGAASGYFLLALLWSRFYSLILLFSPESFRDGATGAPPDSASVLYFSLVSLTTLGYGDITPITPYARLTSAIHAGIGSLYIAIVVAALVGRLRDSTPSSDR